ncbi:MAG: hypothetical protein PHQ27_09730 [Victivallales bacterium]|nr:hypothetical protein [Victivallales bacterium]
MKNVQFNPCFTANPATAAFLALTFWGIATYLILSLVPYFIIEGWQMGFISCRMEKMIEVLQYLLLFSALLWCNYVSWTTWFYWRQCQRHHYRRRRYFIWPIFLLWLAIPALIGCDNEDELISLILIMQLPPAVIFPLLCGGKDWPWALGSIVTGAAGVFMVLVPCQQIVRLCKPVSSLGDPTPPPPFTAFVRFLGLAGTGWTVWFATALLLLLAWYLLTAKFMARREHIPFRTMFGRAVRWLWYAVAAVFILFAIMTWREKNEAARLMIALEQRFGRPPTTTAFRDYYYRHETPDQAYWNRISTLNQKISYAIKTHPGLPDPAVTAPYSTDELAVLRNFFHHHALLIGQWESAFRGHIPPMQQSTTPGTFWSHATTAGLAVSIFTQLQLWQLRVALADNNINAAWTAYRNLAHADALLLRGNSGLDVIVWLKGENRRLDAISLLLTSERLTAAQLTQLNRELTAVAVQLAPFQKHCLYIDAVGGLDIFDMLGQAITGNNDFNPVPPAMLRWFFPQLWWYAVREKTTMMRYLDGSDLRHAPTPDELYRCPLIINGLYFPLTHNTGERFLVLAARIRKMQARLALEQYRRQQRYDLEPRSLLPSVPDTIPRTVFCRDAGRLRHGDPDY